MTGAAVDRVAARSRREFAEGCMGRWLGGGKGRHGEEFPILSAVTTRPAVHTTRSPPSCLTAHGGCAVAVSSSEGVDSQSYVLARRR